MKPELKAMVAQAAGGSPHYLEKVFLAALHWRDDEFWCGPLRLGRTHHANEDGEDYHFGYIETPGVREVDSTSKVECRAALEAAAREQIAKWFKEQS